MNKHFFFIVISLILLTLFACNLQDLQLPTAIEIKGNPELAIPINKDIGKIIFDAIADGFNGADVKLIPCNNTDTQTYIVYSVYEETQSIQNLSSILPTGNINTDVSVFTESIEIPLSNDYLTGFTFSGAEVILYAYSNKPEIVDLLAVKVNGDIVNKIKEKSDYANWTNGYSGKSAPNNSNPILLSCEDTALNVEVFVPAGTNISNPAIFNGANLSIEVVFWLPFALEAGVSGGKVVFPDDLFSDGDLFGRDEPDSENKMAEYIESLEFNLRFNHTVFSGASLVVESTGIYLPNTISGNSLGFSLDKDKMEAINKPENFPFTPKLSIEVVPGGGLVFPKGLKLTELAFKAKIKYRIDLSKEET